MKEVRLSKVSIVEIRVLQEEIEQFGTWQRMGLHYWSNEDFFNALATIDLSARLYFLLRKKVESEQQKFTFKLKVHEAVVLLKCCWWERSERNDYQKHVAEKFKGIIDEQLKSFVNHQ